MKWQKLTEVNVTIRAIATELPLAKNIGCACHVVFFSPEILVLCENWREAGKLNAQPSLFEDKDAAQAVYFFFSRLSFGLFLLPKFGVTSCAPNVTAAGPIPAQVRPQLKQAEILRGACPLRATERQKQPVLFCILCEV